MRQSFSIALALVCVGPLQAQPEVQVFDGKTTAGWVVRGDAEVKDGVLVLGGAQKTWARIAADFSPEYQLQLEYTTENSKLIQFEWNHNHLLGQGGGSMTLMRDAKPGEWTEA